ncbi:pilus assembly PilX family protein [Rhodoferax aquaticus]|uniref:Pilus assembly protein n=1 Tax=Rhodoferax aquaticus TaxID=2527691 RepID=A0A515ENL4_9BURK|nr:PilX N-terminal domain-containing pilus assembly protein [Rhodoferax aquaticus]QDL54235.1 pilus assembly protein [Rhodoferax aquaticus]
MRYEKGVTLVISLIILAIMTLLGIATIRQITAEERLTSNMYDRNLALQATEAALKEIETLVESEKPTPAAGANCAKIGKINVCGITTASTNARWLDTAFTGWENASTVGSGSLAITPKYFVEYLGNTFSCRPGDSSDPYNCRRYRITAQTDGGTGRATVMLQSIYATE